MSKNCEPYRAILRTASKLSLAAVDFPCIRQTRFLVMAFMVTIFLAACGNSQVVQPGMLEASTGMSSSLRMEQEVPKSGIEASISSTTGNSDPGEGDLEDTSNNPGVSPENTNQESNNPTPISAVTDPTPTIGPTEAEVVPQVPPPADMSLPVGPQIGNRAPDFALQTLDGQKIALSDLLGKPLVINYWATWCVPCKEELPILEQLFQEYQSRGLVIVSVDAIEQDTEEKLQAVISQLGMTFPTLLDENNQFADAYQAIFFPTSFFIDASGVIRDVTLGDSSEEIFRQKIERLLSGTF